MKMSLRFSEQIDNRYTRMESNKDTVYFHPLESPPETLFVMDITASPKNWQNRGCTIFYESDKTIKLASENP